MQAALLDKRRDGNDPSGLHNNFHDIESFLESVLVPTPVSISAELVPSVLSRGLGLACESYSLGQQGSNDRRSGRPRSSVSNGVGNTNTNNNTTVGATAPKVRFDLINTVNNTLMNNGMNNGMNPGVNKDEAKNNLVTSQHLNQEDPSNPNADANVNPNVDPKKLRKDEKAAKTRKRDNNSTAGGTSRKKKTNHKVGSPTTVAYVAGPAPGGGVPQMQPAQYVFGMPQMGLPPQMPPQQVQQMQQQMQQIHMQQQMGQVAPMGPMGPMHLGPAYMYGPPVQLPDGRIVGFYPPNVAEPAPEKVEKESSPDHAVKRSRLVWTDNLHKKFLDAVERCGGIEHALPKAIMNDMKVAGLTRENVSSHLQKYRIRVKEEQEKEAEKSRGEDAEDGEREREAGGENAGESGDVKAEDGADVEPEGGGDVGDDAGECCVERPRRRRRKGA